MKPSTVGELLHWSYANLAMAHAAMDGEATKYGRVHVLAWLAGRGEFPPLLLLRRYLKLAIELSRSAGQLTVPLDTVGELPFELSAVPTRFPPPGTLRLWVTDLA